MTASTIELPEGLEITTALPDGAEKVLTPDALSLIVSLHRKFAATRKERLAARVDRQARLDAGEELDFLEEARAIREDDSWQVAAPAPGLEDRRVALTA